VKLGTKLSNASIAVLLLMHFNEVRYWYRLSFQPWHLFETRRLSDKFYSMYMKSVLIYADVMKYRYDKCVMC